MRSPVVTTLSPTAWLPPLILSREVVLTNVSLRGRYLLQERP